MLYSQIIKICRVALRLTANDNNGKALGSAGPLSVHMGSMIEPTLTATLIDHLTPEDEPSIGTVASFHYRLASGGDSTSGYMLRDAGGWRANPNQPARSWAEMVDLNARNAAIQQRTPGTTTRFIRLDVWIHVTPPVERPADRALLVKLQHAVYCAAENLGIETEGVEHTDLVKAIATLAGIRGRA